GRGAARAGRDPRDPGAAHGRHAVAPAHLRAVSVARPGQRSRAGDVVLDTNRCSSTIERMFDVYFRRRIAFLAVFRVLLTGGLRFATPSSGARHTVEYTVQPGDTLWSIASAGHAGDPRAGVAAIRRVNDLASDTIRPGDVLLLP